MTWEEFNDVVRTYLLVDAQRKGKGVQEYIDRMIVASVIEMQRYVPGLRESQIKYFSPSDLVEPNPEELSDVNAEDIDVHQGTFNKGRTRVKQVVIRRVPTEDNNQDISRYLYPKTIPWTARFELIDGGISKRTKAIPGRIAFGADKFFIAPVVGEDEALYIYYEGENHHAPINAATDAEKATPVVYDELVAKTASDYVKAHLAREVDNDLKKYESFFTLYMKGRAAVFINEKEYQSSDALQVISSGVGAGGFVIG